MSLALKLQNSSLSKSQTFNEGFSNPCILIIRADY
jgi:hypothetical protein